jgi:broad specificity phosphatase PhoE
MQFDPVTTNEFPSRLVTSVHLYRHGPVDTGGRRLAYGHTDVPLSRAGKRAHAALVAHARTLPRPDGILSSDLSRCRALAEALAETLDVPLRIEPALREQHMGDWEGRAWGDLSAADSAGIHAYWDDYANIAPPNGESLVDVRDRVRAFWQGAPELTGKRWIVVTHIGVIRCLMCDWLGHSLDEALRFAPARGSHTQLLLAEAGAVVEVLGERVAPVERAARGEGPRLALSGSSGVGKTTLGRALAQELRVPFLEEGMRTRLEGGLVLHDLSRDQMRALVWELWDEQVAAEDAAIQEHGGFVADRSSLDFAAFWLWYGFTREEDEPARFLDTCVAHCARYDRILLLPWGVLELKADGVRSSNRWLQRTFQGLVEGVLSREAPPQLVARMPDLTALDQRLAWALDQRP